MPADSSAIQKPRRGGLRYVLQQLESAASYELEDGLDQVWSSSDHPEHDRNEKAERHDRGKHI
jgi:hypothetical protein